MILNRVEGSSHIEGDLRVKIRMRGGSEICPSIPGRREFRLERTAVRSAGEGGVRVYSRGKRRLEEESWG